MSAEPFKPKNEIEKKLLAAQSGEITGESFMATLLTSELFMPILDETRISGLQPSPLANPLTLTTEGGLETLILFTSPERARNFVRNHPGYEGGLLAEFSWILERVGAGIGISINPGFEDGLDIEAEMIQGMVQGVSE